MPWNYQANSNEFNESSGVRERPPAVDLREQVDLDSMDILNFAIAIHEATGVDIPEADHPQRTRLDRCVTYLHSRTS